jgi:hypothetical protein
LRERVVIGGEHVGLLRHGARGEGGFARQRAKHCKRQRCAGYDANAIPRHAVPDSVSRVTQIVHKGLASGEAQIAIDVQMHSRQGTAPAAAWGRCCLRAIVRSKHVGEETECAVAGC